MAHYVIAGKPDCPNFVHVAYVCFYLQHNLPNFSYKKIQIKSGEWEYWLNDKNIEEGWHHSESPIIWKEVGRSGGKATLIGGISDFWEYCYDYYGLESILPEEDLKDLVEDNQQVFEASAKSKETLTNRRKIVTIMGLPYPYVCSIFPELLKIEKLSTESGMVFRLFDLDLEFEENLDYVLDLMDGLLDMHTEVYLVSGFQQALDNCDVLLNLCNYSQMENEDTECWYIRNSCNMYMIADNINAYAKRTLKVILANTGAPVCFNASVLCQNCTTIKLSNIIAITADWGSCPLSVISKECNISLKDMGAPPVWGFLEHNFIDIGSIVTKCDIPRPYLRAITNSGGSTLPLGKITSELRFTNYLTDSVSDLWQKVDSIRNTVKERLGRPPTYAKVRATMKVLDIWFSEKPRNEIISLGICSNGCFGFPAGIVVSQPVVFNGRNWVPFKDFPLQEYAKKEVENLIPRINKLLDKFDVH